MVKIYWGPETIAVVNHTLSVDGVVLLVQCGVGGLGGVHRHTLAAQPGIVLGGALGIGGLLDGDVALMDLLVQAVELQVDLWGRLGAEGLGLLQNCVELRG